MNSAKNWMLSAACSAALLGCATPPERQPVKLDEVKSLGKQKLATDALIEQIEQRGVDFSLTPAENEQLKNAGVREPVLRYLQGRAAGERAAGNDIYRNSFNDPFCSYALPLYPFATRYYYRR